MVIYMGKFVIIGANSYIARNLITVLFHDSKSHEIIMYGKEESQADGFVPYVQVDVLNMESVETIDMDCDAIFFFVGRTGPARAFEEYASYIDVNEKALLNVITAYVRKKSKAKFVYPSSRLVYKGKDGFLTEESEKDNKSIYAINKNASERYLQLYHDIYGLQYLIFRICVPYGMLIPGEMSYGTIGFMLSSAQKHNDISLYGEGENRRTLTYIGDLCTAMVRGVQTDECVNDVYNIGGENYSLREMAELIANKYGINVKYVPWPELDYKLESGSTVFDSSKLDRVIAYRTTSFKKWIGGVKS